MFLGMQFCNKSALLNLEMAQNGPETFTGLLRNGPLAWPVTVFPLALLLLLCNLAWCQGQSQGLIKCSLNDILWLLFFL